MGDLLQICEMAVKQSASDSQEVGVSGILNLHNTPGILPGPHFPSINLNEIFRADNREWHKPTQLSVLFDCVFIILLNIVGEIVHRDAIVLNILHDELLGLGEFGRGEGIGFSDNGDDIDTRRKTFHQFDIQLAQAVTCGCDKVEEDMDTVVPEARVTLDSRFFSKNIVILAFEVSDDFTKAEEQSVLRRTCGTGFYMPGFIVNLVTKTGGINDGEGNPGAFVV